jgi:TrmH family RNA methyltransferase
VRPVVITSPANPIVKAALALRDKPGQAPHGAFLVEGPHLLEMALSSPAKVARVFFTEEFGRKQEGQRLIRKVRHHISLADQEAAEPTFVEVSEQVFTRLSDTRTPQGILAIISIAPAALEDLSLGAAPVLVLCEGIQDPGNLGAIIRVADAAAADAVIILPATCNPYNQKVIRSTAGSLFNIPIVRTAAKGLLDWLAVRDIPLLATDIHGAVSVFDLDLTGPCALAFGSEAHGVSEAVRKAADRTIRIPILGKAESLNVAMSASVCLFEAVRQRAKST